VYFVGYHITPAAALVEPEFNRFVGAALRPSYRGGTWFESTAAHPDVSEPPGDGQKSATGPTCRAAGTVRSPYTLRKYGAGGGDLAQHGRDRIDQCCDLFADGVPATGWGRGMDRR
jgi:hypothetical protein